MNNETLLLKINENLVEILRLLESRKGDVPFVRDISHTPARDTVDKKITRIFISVGIAANLIINSIMSKLYPEIALRFETSKSKVERAMRHAIEAAWNRGKMENINSLFGMRVYNSREKPTNSEFIALIADKIMLDAV